MRTRPDLHKCDSCPYLYEEDSSCTYGPGCYQDDLAYDQWVNQGIDQEEE